MAPSTATEGPSAVPTSDPVLVAIDSYPDQLIGRNSDYSRAVRRLVEDSRWTKEEKFDFLEKQSSRSEERGAHLAYFLAELDWPRFVTYVSGRKKPLGPKEWHAICVALYDHRKEWVRANQASQDVAGNFEYPPALISRFLDRAQFVPSREARVCMIATLNRAGVTVEQALVLATTLATEIDPSVREAILLVQTQHNDPRTNRVVRDALRGPLEHDLVHGLPTSSLVERNRYDFLPDLRALRERLAHETDVRKKQEAIQLEGDVAKAIEKLEARKAQKAPIGGKPPKDDR